MRNLLKNSKRIVVKVGTSTLMYANGTINLRTIDRLVRVLSDLKNEGREVILVSSGAIGVGCHKLQLKERPVTMPEKQAIAAVGQSELMHIYSKFFSEYGYMVGQVLLTRDIIDYPISRKNVMNTFNTLIQKNIIPIVNENDTVAVEEIEHMTKFGDNDFLSAVVTKLVDASLLVVLSDINGFYEKDPTVDSNAKMFNEIHEITAEILGLAGGKGSEFGTGGMQTKLAAADYCLQSNRKMILANGSDPEILYDILTGKMIGTLFASSKKEDPIQ